MLASNPILSAPKTGFSSCWLSVLAGSFTKSRKLQFLIKDGWLSSLNAFSAFKNTFLPDQYDFPRQGYREVSPGILKIIFSSTGPETPGGFNTHP